ncbi:FtsH-interacting integral membrane protein [Synechococcus sp. PCC 7502]|uniref:Bax inhibitor-1/YccA family protein n=1 Tax=Synechococcus sp. PCC 7502 TaxID=1173263 RepID=UPI00029FC343|nr:Bax inhibitor-1 family protein [Synechococcus sp. PCC 7502]AFY73745.1 FtsH-interacting integral membrane protein [Synechococcus sp. PCC 7502]
MTTIVSQASPNDRQQFIQKTYLHLAAAVALFVGLEVILFVTPAADAIISLIFSLPFSWLVVLGGFMLLGWLARTLASRTSSIQTQYIGLGLYVVGEAIIFVPLLYIAVHFTSPEVLPSAAILTGLLFAGLTTIAFTTKADFSFLGGILTMVGFVALGMIICSVIFGFKLGIFFSFAMIVFASAAILYDTSNVIHHYTTDQYVAAALELFASVALLFWYVLRILIQLNSRN